MTEENNLKKSTEKHRYCLAMLFIGGFLVIIFTALLGEFSGRYTGLKDLAAVFSGWITAVIGFYFLQQNTERAQQQTTGAIKEAADARKTLESATERTAKLATASGSSILELTETLEKQKDSIKKQNEIIRKQKEFITDILSKLEELGKLTGLG